jgi:hypothetical protein
MWFYNQSTAAYDAAQEALDEAKGFIRGTERKKYKPLWESLGNEEEEYPMKDLMDLVVSDAQNLMTEEGAQGLYETVSEPAFAAIEAGAIASERSLAAQQHEASVFMDQPSKMGVGSDPYARTAAQRRMSEATGFGRAQIATQAAQQKAGVAVQTRQWVEELRRNWAGNAQQMAYQWMKNAPEVRTEYVNNMMDLFQQSAAIYAHQGGGAMDVGVKTAAIEEQKRQFDEENKTNWWGTAISIVGAIASIWNPAIGGALMAVGGAVGGGIGGMFGGGGDEGGGSSNYLEYEQPGYMPSY